MARARPSRIRKAHGLSRQRLLLLAEAAGTLAAVSFALHALPFKRVIRMGSVRLANRSPTATAHDCVWAVEAAARRVPWRAVCIQQGIAAQRMLRRRGIDAVLHYGIASRGAAAKLEAHVWVTVEGRPVIGGEEARGFAPVAAYP